jgi:cephalosporin-C deacetylase-like acetyl esterase
MSSEIRLPVLIPFLLFSIAFGADSTLFDEPELFSAPKILWIDSTGPDYSLTYETVAYKGVMAQAFAFFSIPPESASNLPAMVLVHGGGCSADQNWAKQWAGLGYAALAIDLNGKDVAYGRPWDADNFGAGEQIPLTDTWYYHAVATVMRAVSLLRSQPTIDSSRIGVLGISWGGWITCIVAGVDSRIKAAAPVYGCGFINETSRWSPIASPSYLKYFDPSNYLPRATLPMLWISGAHDCCYPASIRRKSYRLTQGQNTIHLQPDIGHDCTRARTYPEIARFFDSQFRNGIGLARIESWGWKPGEMWATYGSSLDIKDAALLYATDSLGWNHWKQMQWNAIPATIDIRKKRIRAPVPPAAAVYYLLVNDIAGMKVSTEHVDRASDPARGSRNVKEELRKR